ncbi:MAG: 30S ribosomal protein S16 [Planctomycetota bacterium]
MSTRETRSRALQETRIMVRLRLKRFGRTHRPFYRLNAIDKRSPRDGKPIEQLGHYDPCHKDEARQVNLQEDRVRYWLGVGAQPSETVRDLLIKAGILDKATGKATPAPEPAAAE